MKNDSAVKVIEDSYGMCQLHGEYRPSSITSCRASPWTHIRPDQMTEETQTDLQGEVNRLKERLAFVEKVRPITITEMVSVRIAYSSILDVDTDVCSEVSGGCRPPD